MPEIIPLLECLSPYLSTTEIRQFYVIIQAVLCITHRVTMVGIARWTAGGGSYRTVQRWYGREKAWAAIHWGLVEKHLVKTGQVYILAGDDVVVSKAGQATSGVGRFYSGLAQRCIPGIAFLGIALVDVAARRAYPLHITQYPPRRGAVSARPRQKRQPGRPKGGKNHVKAAPVLTAELQQLQQALTAVRERIGATITVRHVALDGAFGTYPATAAVRQSGFHLISKLRHNAALYLPFSGPKPRRGPTPRYGAKLDYAALPPALLVQTTLEAHFRTDTYHATLLHKDFADPLNVVILVKIDSRTGKRAHIVLFSTDLTLSAAPLVDYYRLRFQIEFIFRDTKQYWGLEDFMNIAPTPVTNAANLAFFMVTLTAILSQSQPTHAPPLSVLDLKAQFRAHRYLAETIKWLPFAPDDYLISRLWGKLTALGGIHPVHDPPIAA
jgi:putative transposase